MATVVRVLRRAVASVGGIGVHRIIIVQAETTVEAVARTGVVAPVEIRVVETVTAITGGRKTTLVVVDEADKSEAMNRSSLMMQN